MNYMGNFNVIVRYHGVLAREDIVTYMHDIRYAIEYYPQSTRSR